MNATLPAEPIPFRVLLDEAMKLTRRQFGAMFLPVAVPLALLGGFVAWAQLRYLRDMAAGGEANPFTSAGCIGYFSVILLYLILGGLSSAVLTAGAVDGVAGRPISMSASWKFILRLPTLWTLLLCLVVVVVGFCLLIFPGIYFALRLSFVVPVMATEGLTGTAAMGRSWKLVKYNPQKRFLANTATKIFVLYLVAVLISWLLGLVVQAPFSAIQGVAAARDVSAGQPGSIATAIHWTQIPSQMLSQLVSTATGIYAAFGIALLYFDVVRRKEGSDLATAIDARFGGPAPQPGAPV